MNTSNHTHCNKKRPLILLENKSISNLLYLHLLGTIRCNTSKMTTSYRSHTDLIKDINNKVNNKRRYCYTYFISFLSPLPAVLVVGTFYFATKRRQHMEVEGFSNTFCCFKKSKELINVENSVSLCSI